MIPILVILHIVVIACILWIGGGRFAIVPVFGLLGLIGSSGASEKTDSMSVESIQEFAQRHAMTIAWLCMLMGVWGVASAFTGIVLDVLLSLIAINMVLWGISHIREYDIGRSMFQIGMVTSMVMVMIYGLSHTDLYSWVHILLVFVTLSTAIRSFFVFVVPCVTGLSYRRDQYVFFILTNVMFLIWIYGRGRGDLPSAVVLAQMYLMLLYCLIYAVYRYTDHLAETKESTDDIVDQILSGQNILGYTKQKSSDFLKQIREFLLSLDLRTQSIVGFLNIIVVLLQVYIFARGVGGDQIWMNEILLRFGIAAFFVNYLLLRTIGFGHQMQRVLAFILITGGIYLTIIHIFADDMFARLVLGVIWTVGNSLLLLVVPHVTLGGLLLREDYRSWILSLGGSSIVNIVFLFQMGYHIQLSFSLMLLYVALQIFLILYARNNHIVPHLSVSNDNGQMGNKG